MNEKIVKVLGTVGRGDYQGKLEREQQGEEPRTL